MSKLAPIFTLLLFVACASVNVGRDYTLTENSKDGLLVASLSGEGMADGEMPVWMYRRSDGTAKGEIITGYLREPLDWKNPPGRLAYIALVPGRYEFYRAGFSRQQSPTTTTWTTGQGGIATANNPSFAGFNAAQYAPLDAQPFSVPFEIAPGKATYIGNLHFVWQETEWKGHVTLQDRAERDLALLQQRLPNVRRDQIRLTRQD